MDAMNLAKLNQQSMLKTIENNQNARRMNAELGLKGAEVSGQMPSAMDYITTGLGGAIQGGIAGYQLGATMEQMDPDKAFQVKQMEYLDSLMGKETLGKIGELNKTLSPQIDSLKELGIWDDAFGNIDITNKGVFPSQDPRVYDTLNMNPITDINSIDPNLPGLENRSTDYFLNPELVSVQVPQFSFPTIGASSPVQSGLNYDTFNYLIGDEKFRKRTGRYNQSFSPRDLFTIPTRF